MAANNGLRDTPRLTQSSVLDAGCATVAALRNGWSDQEMADRWGVSAGTVNNAQNKRHELALTNFLRLGDKFGPEGVNTFLALVGLKAVLDSAVTVDVADIPCDLARCLPLLIELLRDGECSEADVRKLQGAGAIEPILRIADFLRQRRDDVRLQVAK